MLNQTLEFEPFIEFLFIIFIIVLMVYLYNKTEGYWLMIFTLVFSSIITTISISNNVLPFTPYIQTFFIIFQLIIVIFKLFNLKQRCFTITNYKKKPVNKKKGLKFKSAIDIHEKRSIKSRKIDESKNAKIIRKNLNKNWKKNPSKSDILGIDTKKSKAKNSNEVIRFLKGIYPEVSTIPKTKNVLRLKKPLRDKRNKLQRITNIRYGNVKITKRKKKNTPNDYRITIRR